MQHGNKLNTSFFILRVKLRFLRCKHKEWFFREKLRNILLRCFSVLNPRLRSENLHILKLFDLGYFRLMIIKRTNFICIHGMKGF
ncbi:hypothetical protein CHH92_20045 [Bacillus sonorensis]|nr:hypothetical protein CHH92_20045 [Bacillus sonorensis]RHJ08276.1 hypothetical protein DW143_16110 [Bacillus sonorensis]